jgi:caffeoyl-CoA O-methyltransferase
MHVVTPALEQYAHDRTRAEPALLDELAAQTRRERADHGMLCGRLEGRFLKLLVQLSGARRILELGLFTGYSALSMAEGLPAGGELITCDIDPAAKEFAERYFARSPHGAKIAIRLGPALETIATLRGPFDLVFIDADKERYLDYYQAVVELVRPGGLIVIDNTLWSGRVLKPEQEADRTIDALNRFIASDERVENVLLTLRDGVQLVRKKD